MLLFALSAKRILHQFIWENFVRSEAFIIICFCEIQPRSEGESVCVPGGVGESRISVSVAGDYRPNEVARTSVPLISEGALQ